ncbi:hypothetical protein [Vibrio tarriae]|uniref:hypothetical protein n=1 Tax=Vibrio tarriae TaxID=2014742 RepID=UPI0015EE3A30|nr:hypothetical protein [Vibrio tarriae]
MLRLQARDSELPEPIFNPEWYELGSFSRSYRRAEIGDKASCLGVTLLSGSDLL